MEFDCLIVGAGFSGLVMAERLATLFGLNSLVVEKRRHFGGNAYDCYDDHGVLIHKYGPHYFRTNSPMIKNYLSQFTQWHEVAYRVRSFTEGRFWTFPINLKTFEEMIGRPSSSEEMEAWMEAQRVPIENPQNSEDVIVSQVGWELYEKFFKGYTLKQWKRDPKELDASVCGRIPIRTNRDDRYLRESFQALPSAGYTRMFERMIDACGEKVSLMLNTDYRDISHLIRFRHMVYTGPIDAYFNHCFGPLPYRSLRFEVEHYSGQALREREEISGKMGYWQPELQVNYPDAQVAFTRTVELKHATGQACLNTTIVREFPDDYTLDKEPYYPVPAEDSKILYRRYKALADVEPNVSFIGRLATYKYYNMDQVVGVALKKAHDLGQRLANMKQSIN